MGLTMEQRRRVTELTRELHELLGDSLHSDGRPMTFAELEDECIEVGDLLTTAVLQLRVAERAIRRQPPSCPECGRDPIALAEDDARVLQTDRGEVGWMESAFGIHSAICSSRPFGRKAGKTGQMDKAFS